MRKLRLCLSVVVALVCAILSGAPAWALVPHRGQWSGSHVHFVVHHADDGTVRVFDLRRGHQHLPPATVEDGRFRSCTPIGGGGRLCIAGHFTDASSATGWASWEGSVLHAGFHEPWHATPA